METKDINTLSTTVQYVTCKHCNIEKKRFKNGVYPNAKDAKLVNEDGRQWSGRSCPDCHSTRNALRQKNARANRKLHV